MPGQFFTKAEREKFQSFPSEPTEADIITFFTLSSQEIALVKKRTGNLNRLAFAIQLGALRYLGFVPDELSQTPRTIINYLAEQLKIDPKGLDNYYQRPSTKTNQLQQIRLHLGWRKPTSSDLVLWENWLLDRALEHDRPTLLFQLLCDQLRSEKIVRPGVTIFERMVSNARFRATTETFRRLEFLLTTSTRAFLDSLLVPDQITGKTPVTWLRRQATTNSPNSILNALSKLTFLEKHHVPSWNLSSLNPNRLKFLAQLAKKSSTQSLAKVSEERRYPILVAFVFQIFEEVTDEVMDLFIHCLAETYSRARQDLEEFRRREAKATNEKVRLFKELGQVILDETVENQEVRQQIYQRISPNELKEALEECQRLLRPDDDNYFDYLANRYSYLRRFAPGFFSVFRFSSNLKSDPLLKAVKLLHQLDRENRRKVPADAPTAFVSPKWATYMFDQQGNIVRRYYEMCVLWELRRALRSGDVWLDNSRRYANPESYLIPTSEWKGLRQEVCQMLQLPKAGKQKLFQKGEELTAQLDQFKQTIADNDQVRLDANGDLIVSPLKAEDLPTSSQALQQLIGQHLPQIDLSELLIEIDKLTGFSHALVHAGGKSWSNQEDQKYLYAAILAQACNLGLARMATIASFEL